MGVVPSQQVNTKRNTGSRPRCHSQAAGGADQPPSRACVPPPLTNGGLCRPSAQVEVANKKVPWQQYEEKRLKYVEDKQVRWAAPRLQSRSPTAIVQLHQGMSIGPPRPPAWPPVSTSTCPPSPAPNLRVSGQGFAQLWPGCCMQGASCKLCTHRMVPLHRSSPQKLKEAKEHLAQLQREAQEDEGPLAERQQRLAQLRAAKAKIEGDMRRVDARLSGSNAAGGSRGGQQNGLEDEMNDAVSGGDPPGAPPAARRLRVQE